MSLHITLLDGPLAGSAFTIPRCPQRVRCVRDSRSGQVAILDLPDDKPEPTEVVYWYRWDGQPPGFACYRNPRRSVRLAMYLHAPELASIDDARQARQLEMPL